MKLEISGGATKSPVYIAAMSVRHSTTAMGVCLCAVPAGQSKFVIPAPVLANLPETEAEAVLPLSLVFLISAPPPSLFQTRGLDRGFVLPVTVIGRTVEFR